MAKLLQAEASTFRATCITTMDFSKALTVSSMSEHPLGNSLGTLALGFDGLHVRVTDFAVSIGYFLVHWLVLDAAHAGGLAFIWTIVLGFAAVVMIQGAACLGDALRMEMVHF